MAEAGIEERFHNISIIDEQGALQPGAVIFLSPAQRRVLMEQNLIRMPWAHDEANIWTLARIKETINELRGIGLFNHLDEKQIVVIQEQIRPEYIASPISILGEFPDTACWFDTEYIYHVIEAYTELVEKVSQISHGIFIPENISVIVGPEMLGYEKKEFINLSFGYRGRDYSCDLKDMDDWVDLSFIVLMNQALSEAGQAGRFYGIDTGDQTALVIFLTEQQRETIQQKDLFSLWEFRRNP
jgi:hypothetical protein